MRTTRIIILFVFVIATFFVVVRSFAARSAISTTYPTSSSSRRSFLGFMYYNTPFSLFPPNAAISLTDDNSTSFAARPAAFGPKLASSGLSGPLWVGSGFAEDSLESNGELGCSDLPGWERSQSRITLRKSLQPVMAGTSNEVPTAPKRHDDITDRSKVDSPSKIELDANRRDDGTDDYLHVGGISNIARWDGLSSSSHADIQSIQEAAEIEGKVVLLMRGGCGFLEKVMWAQRRGAVAVIVGDNQRGGPLIQMFARGDEIENVTIPSVFTARTTAQLLSSLTQPGSFIEDMLDDNGKPVLKVQKSSDAAPKKSTPQGRKRASGSVSSSSLFGRPPKPGTPSLPEKKQEDEASTRKKSWFSTLLHREQSPYTSRGTSRPPNSGQLDWKSAKDWNHDKGKILRIGIEEGSESRKPKQAVVDDFIIGVQDWRDPDLLTKVSSDSKDVSSTSIVDDSSSGSSTHGSNDLVSGVTKSGNSQRKGMSSEVVKPYDDLATTASKDNHGFFSKLFRTSEETEGHATASGMRSADGESQVHQPEFGPHEGLWVTIIPTSGASPFFDTLLVLVVSPLVTLTVVYALLILRARIRRRRWRAPKSVVERLPVRTYHTVATSPSLSSRAPSPSLATPTTPLLQRSGTTSRPRPRSRTTIGIPESESLLVAESSIPTATSASRGRSRVEYEKGAGGFSAEWRKYMGRQVECVVCLEEYVDGVSRVMSLPCGHEFHADCITPWLTTRRRTCPICKGDVVRSLAHGSRSIPRYREDTDGDSDGESSSPSFNSEEDVEQGIIASPSSPRQTPTNESWFGTLATSLGNRQMGRVRSPSPNDRHH